ncbi:gliding motility-associated C-terminal domain-containing protein [Hymenobacter aerilatus]|uniref:Gliding motility-associated C-terminal domain-containing protein n=1 Tax=Hymenobacter aerilatus TaxID=2932251 RepID=A0A8T9T2P1_9BACT|nr:gliding motility-associated C-terminal domain-containing protein [Hymenobacter aerilatus]UOR07444.1 gliding motility-associated C-terminal domain-containing protein [Hymenobacter aerilatus]
MKLYQLFLCGLLSIVGLTAARAQCPTSPPSAQARFRFFDVETKQEITGRFLCVGKRVRIVDASTPRLVPGQVFYQWQTSVACRGFTDTTSFYTPTTAGPIVLTANINQNQAGGGSSGLLVAYPAFEVKTSPPPTFSLVSCTPGAVQVTVTDATYDRYTVQVGSGTAVAAARNTTITYPVPAGSPTTVTVAGYYTAATLCSNSATQPFTSPPLAQAARFQRLSLTGTTAQLTFAGLQAGYQYSLQLRDASAPGGYRTLTALSAAASSYSLPNAAVPGCYRLLQTDACQPSVTKLTSNELCTIGLTATAQNNQNLLTWATDQAGPFEVVREGQVVAQLPAGATRYTDAAVVCGTSYTYRVRTVGSSVSESGEARATAISTDAPPAPVLLATYTLRNQIELSVGSAAGSNVQYTYLRDASPLATTTARLLRDSTQATPATLAPACYTATVRDACGNTSPPSAAVCPVVLTAEATTAEGTIVRLTWTALGAPTPSAPVTYRLLTLAPDNTVLNARPVTLPTTLDQPAADQQVLRYRIEATGGGLPAPSYSNVATVPRRLQIVIPNAFSPNGDGQNDVFGVKGRFLGSFLLVVVDRSGQEVFRATDRSQTWDGRIGGRLPVPATYVWRFEATDATGQRTVDHGTVTILR